MGRLRTGPWLTLLLAAALAGCFTSPSQATVVIDFGGQGHEPDLWTHTVTFDEDLRPSHPAYREKDAEPLDAYTVHDLMVEWSSAQGVPIETAYFGTIGFSLEGIDGVASEFENGCWFWSLSVNGESSDEGMSSVVVEHGDTVRWTYTGCE